MNMHNNESGVLPTAPQPSRKMSGKNSICYVQLNDGSGYIEYEYNLVGELCIFFPSLSQGFGRG